MRISFVIRDLARRLGVGASQKIETLCRRGKLRLTPTSTLRTLEPFPRCSGNAATLRLASGVPRSIIFAQECFRGGSLGVRWNSPFHSLKNILGPLGVVVFLLTSFPVFGAELGDGVVLHWKNGDALPGSLLPSEGKQIRWDSSIFDDEMIIDCASLASIRFPREKNEAKGAFRIGTIGGDLLVADLVGSDDQTLIFESERHGRLNILRDAIYSLHRIEQPNLIFDGSRFRDWEVALGGPIQNLRYRVYTAKKEWLAGPFPDLSGLEIVQEGRLASSYFDLGISDTKQQFAMVFEGHLQIEDAAVHEFHVSADERMRLWIDGELLVEAGEDGVVSNQIALEAGSHAMRVEYLNGEGMGELRVWWTGPGFKNRSLVGTNRESGWHAGIGAHPTTQLVRSALFRDFDLQGRVEMNVELASSSNPRFVIAFGKDEYSAEEKSALRLESWGNEIAVIQNNIFETVLTPEEDQRDIRLRMVLDVPNRHVDVFGMSGRLLVSIDDVDLDAGGSGVYVRNLGEDLIVRRLSLLRSPKVLAQDKVDAFLDRVYLIDGTVLYGKLSVQGEQMSVQVETGEVKTFNLSRLGRIDRPEAILGPVQDATELSYQDGGVIRGDVVTVDRQRMAFKTIFNQQPVSCDLSGASAIRFNASPSLATSPMDFRDVLVLQEGKIRGKLSYGLPDAPLGWTPAGAVVPLKLSDVGKARVMRDQDSLPYEYPEYLDEASSMLFLNSGEAIPCRVISYDQEALELQSPIIETNKISAGVIKAIDFSPDRNLLTVDQLYRESGNVSRRNGRQRDGGQVVSKSLERALLTPRFKRNQADNHLLVAHNGDMMRGRLLGVNDQTIRFESKLKEMQIPRDLCARIVSIQSKQEEEDDKAGAELGAESGVGRVRVILQDGSIVVFRPLSSTDESIIGYSEFYGSLSIPTEYIADMLLGNETFEPYEPPFSEWVKKPPLEPSFD